MLIGKSDNHTVFSNTQFAVPISLLQKSICLYFKLTIHNCCKLLHYVAASFLIMQVSHLLFIKYNNV